MDEKELLIKIIENCFYGGRDGIYWRWMSESLMEVLDADLYSELKAFINKNMDDTSLSFVKRSE